MQGGSQAGESPWGLREGFQDWGSTVKRKPLLPQILSRGQIVSVTREPRTDLTSVSVFVDHHLVPSFYLVAFYYHGGVPVANSLRVDVQPGACEGKVTGFGRGGASVHEGVKRERRQCEQGTDLLWGTLGTHRAE